MFTFVTLLRALKPFLAVLSIFLVGNVCANPDLLISSARINSTVVTVGNTLSLDFVVKNIGSQSAADSYTGFFVSSDTVPGLGDVYLTSNFCTGFPFGDSSVVAGQVLSIPQNITGGNYYILIYSDYDSDVAEVNEYNNVRAIPFTLQLGQPRDLFVQLGSSATMIEQGNSITLTASLQNLQAGRIGPNYSGVFLSADTSYSNNDISIAQLIYTGDMDGYEDISHSVSVDIPYNVLPGTYHVLVVADIMGAISESNEFNNVTRLTITVLPKGNSGDLSISNATVPSQLIIGATINHTFQLHNTGPSAVSTSYTKVYLSSDQLLSTEDILLSSIYCHAMAGQSERNFGGGFKISGSVTPGNYYVLFAADNQNAISETNENNNISSSAAISVVLPYQDVEVIATSFSTSSGEEGTLVNFSNTTRNNSAVVEPLYVSIYLSTNTTLDASDLSLANKCGTIGGFSNSVFSGNLTIPSGLTPGNYYLIVKADYYEYIVESNEINNLFVAPFQLLPNSGNTDLQISTSNLPTSIEPGSTEYIYQQVYNAGTSASGKWSQNGIYFSSNDALDINDIKLNTSWIMSVPGGQTAWSGTYVQIPSSTSPGNYFIIVKADDSDTIFETNENNNTTAYAIQVVAPANRDLAVSQVSLASTTFEIGIPNTISFRISNVGTVEAPNSYTRIFISEDAVFDWSDYDISSLEQSQLQPGEFTDYENVELLPTDYLTTGNYYLIVVADNDNNVVESDEENNYFAIPIVLENPNRDLTISSIALLNGSTHSAGDVLKFSFIENNSGSRSAGYNAVQFYLSTNNTPDDDDYPLNQFLMPEIAAGSNATIPYMEVSLPLLPLSGTYFLIIKADSWENVLESTETNNYNFIPFQFTGIPTPDLIPTVVGEIPAIISTQTDVLIKRRIYNMGNTATTSASHVDWYVSADSIADVNDIVLYGFYNEIPTIASGAYSDDEDYLTFYDVPPGEYYLILHADFYHEIVEGNENNNFVYAQIEVTESTEHDLQVSHLSSGVTSIVSAGQLSINYSVFCEGTMSTSVEGTIAFSSNPTYGPEDTDIHFISGYLAPNATMNAHETIAIPTVASGTYYLIMKLSYYQDYDANEMNNTRVIPIQIVNESIVNIALKDGTLSSSEILPTGATDFSFTLKDVGTDGEITQNNIRILISLDAVPDAGDFVVEELDRSLESRGDSIKISSTIDLDSELPPGDYYVLAGLESSVTESTISDNVVVLPLKISSAVLTLAEKEETISIILWPNPASERISISGLKNACAVDAIRIIHASGMEVSAYNVTTSGKQLEIDVTNLSNGLYQLLLPEGMASKTFMVAH